MVDVSVIVPVYNAQKNLETCLKSICAQTLRQIEIICIDDGSEDNSLSILKMLAAQDERIVVIEQKNAGAGAARNIGLRRAKGKYLSFLDADDFFEPDMLMEAYLQAEKDHGEVVVFKADFYNDQSGAFLPCVYSLREDLLPGHRPFAGIEIEKDIFKTVVGWAWDKLFLTEFIRSNGLEFQTQRTSNDLLFVFSAMAKAQRITTVPKVLAHQRRNAAGTLSVTREKSWRCFYDALTALRLQLEKWQLYSRFERDFVNYALHFSLWNLNTLKGESQKKLYDMLREAWFDELGITQKNRAFYYQPEEYMQYRLMMRLPYDSRLQWIIGSAQRAMTFCRRRLASRKAEGKLG